MPYNGQGKIQFGVLTSLAPSVVLSKSEDNFSINNEVKSKTLLNSVILPDGQCHIKLKVTLGEIKMCVMS